MAFGYPNDPPIPLASIDTITSNVSNFGVSNFPKVVQMLQLSRGIDGWEVDFSDANNLKIVALGASNKLQFTVRRVSTASEAVGKDKWASRSVLCCLCSIWLNFCLYVKGTPGYKNKLILIDSLSLVKTNGAASTFLAKEGNKCLPGQFWPCLAASLSVPSGIALSPDF